MKQQICTFATVMFAVTFVFVCTGAGQNTDHWPNWRGPNYNGSHATANPPTTWSETENIQWKVPVPGKGSGSPIVWGDQIILVTAMDTGRPGEVAESEPEPEAQQDRQSGRGGRGRGRSREPARPATEHELAVMSYDLNDGSELWRTVVTTVTPHERLHDTNTHASSSAVTDGNRIYVSFGSHGIYCLEMNGDLVWSTDLGQMETRNQFGEGSSPALVGDTLVVPWDHEGQSMLFALDAASGDEKWSTERDERTTWATPLAVQHDGRTQIVMNGSVVRSYDLESGELLWECGGQVSNPIPCPIVIDDFVVCMTGYRGNAIVAMDLDGNGDITDSQSVRWTNNIAAPYVASPALYKGQLYLTKERNGIMTSVDVETGEILIPQTRFSEIEEVYASVVAAGDKIYFTGREGVTIVVPHGSQYEERAINDLGEPVDASPAIVGDTLIIRGLEHLYRIGE